MLEKLANLLPYAGPARGRCPPLAPYRGLVVGGSDTYGMLAYS